MDRALPPADRRRPFSAYSSAFDWPTRIQSIEGVGAEGVPAEQREHATSPLGAKRAVTPVIYHQQEALPRIRRARDNLGVEIGPLTENAVITASVRFPKGDRLVAANAAVV